jgi:ectoine hydroxylase-related dioxygenase (phytanoyl-CoA dioxygenase family)
MIATLERDGYAILPDVLDREAATALCDVVAAEVAGGCREDRRLQADAGAAAFPSGAAVRDRGRTVYAARNLLTLSPAVRRLADAPAVRHLVEPLLGPAARVVRAILFDKTPGANWKVAWHQDLSIAVAERRDVPGFGPWSVKAGVPHVQPPAELLARMVTVRLHLDDCGPDNGPLLVLPGSHRAGPLDAPAVQAWRRRVPAVGCHVPAGGAVMMRPLLLHASAAAATPGHRRVVHLEWPAGGLPGGLRWNEGIG